MKPRLEILVTSSLLENLRWSDVKQSSPSEKKKLFPLQPERMWRIQPVRNYINLIIGHPFHFICLPLQLLISISSRHVSREKERDRRFSSPMILFRVRRNRPLLENVGRLWERIKWHARLLESVVTIFKRELVRERANTFALVSRYERKSLYTPTLMFKRERCATFKRVNADVSPPSFSLNSARGVYKHIPDDNSCFLGAKFPQI